MRRRRSYGALTARSGLPPFRPELLRTARLNTTGWAALTLFCLTGAGLTHLTARTLGSPTRTAAPAGALACLLMVIAADRHRYGHMYTSYSWTDDPDAIVRAATALRAHGIAVHVDTDDERGTRLVYRNRDARRVRRVLHRKGSGQMLMILLAHAELDGLICSGGTADGESNSSAPRSLDAAEPAAASAAYSGVWQTASTLLPSGSRTKAPK